MPEETGRELEVLRMVIDGLSRLERDSQQRIVKTVTTFFDLAEEPPARESVREMAPLLATPSPQYGGHPDISPKEFMYVKAPKTDIERVACLGFYLTHYREAREFNTGDLSVLNTEAAQPRFANAAQAVKNATSRGLLVQTTGGRKQVSAFGEQYVQALPDRSAVQAVAERARPQRKRQSARPKASRR